VQTTKSDVPIDSIGAAGVSDTALRDLLHRHWDQTMERSPTWATMLGDHRFDDRLSDPSHAASERWSEQQQALLEQAKILDNSAMDANDRVTLRLFEEQLSRTVERHACQMDLWTISPRDNAYGQVSDLAVNLPPTSDQAREDLLARYTGIAPYVDTHVINLRLGLDRGLVANATSVDKVLEQLERELEQPVQAWPLWQAVTLAEGPDDDALQAFSHQIESVLDDQVRPALERYVAFLRADVLPRARPDGEEGLSALPDGDICYGVLVRQFTTLPQANAAERHQLGLDELRSIHDEFRSLGARALGTDDLATIFHRLRTEPSLHFETEQQVEDKARSALAKARDAMPQWFGRLPKTECIVERVPDHEAPYTTIAYYRPPTTDHPGRYNINTYLPETRPRHEAEVLAFHESIPGHHLQIAISQELTDLPAFRKHAGMTAFVEGWGLYSERLADEMGLYSSDTDRLGMLSFDSWRAARLVVDTGIHSEGWSRARAEQFLVDNTPLAKNNIANEVDRYITTPGQALSYKTGQLVISRLRRQAEADLGDSFDIRAFHDVVLGAGAVSLPILEERVQAWVQEQKDRK
jgi:uncharacterized protein (DUF885 family)